MHNNSETNIASWEWLWTSIFITNKRIARLTEKVKSAYESSDPSDRSSSQFQEHESD